MVLIAHWPSPSLQVFLCANEFYRTHEPVDEWRFTSLAYVNEKRRKARLRKLKNTTTENRNAMTEEAIDSHILSNTGGAET